MSNRQPPTSSNDVLGRIRPIKVLCSIAAVAVFALVPTARAEAACSGSSPTRTAASASRTDVNDCVTAAANGDTILVPPGTASWSGPIGLPGTKGLTLMGNRGASAMTCSGAPGSSAYSCVATNATSLTCTNGCFEIDFGASHRISGFTMISGGNELISGNGEVDTSKRFRIDNNRLVSTGGWAPIRFFGQQNGNHPQGIWDHNRLENVAIHQNGSSWEMDVSPAQDVIWSKQPVMGDSREVVYIEANYWASMEINATDGNYGCRYVARFNTIEGSYYWTFEVHGMQGYNRGCQRVEIYNNYLKSLSSGGLSELRGGTGFYFNNNSAPGVPANINLTIDRSEYDEAAGNFGPVRECGAGGRDGAGPAGVDQNTAGTNGWRCRDQVGISHDSTRWTHTPLSSPTSWGAWAQVTRPVYMFLNGSSTLVTPNDQGDIENKIVVNREFFCQGGHPGCNNGVRVGTPLPSTCTVGQGFWKTDEGDWNSLNAGPDGQFYRCTAPNVWALDYTPHPYPHPWTTGGSVPPPPDAPAAPTGLRILTSLLLPGVFAWRLRLRHGRVRR